jgi:hypothetical protein
MILSRRRRLTGQVQIYRRPEWGGRVTVMNAVLEEKFV